MIQDQSGVLGMPFRIMAAFLVIGLMLPAVIAVSSDLETRAGEADGEELASRIADAATRVYLSGSGSASTVSFEIPMGAVVTIGGDDPYSIRVSGDGTKEIRHLLDSPLFMLCCPETSLTGSVQLKMEAEPVGGRLCVVVTQIARVHHVPRGGLHMRDPAAGGFRGSCRRGAGRVEG